MQLPLRGLVFCPYFFAITVSAVIAFPSVKEPHSEQDDCQRIWPRSLSSRLTPCYYRCIISTSRDRIYTQVRQEPDGTDCWAPDRGICLHGKCHVDKLSTKGNFLQQHQLGDSLRSRRFKRSLGSFLRKLKKKGKSELGVLRERFGLLKQKQLRQGETLKEKWTQATATWGESLKDHLLNVPGRVKSVVQHNKSGNEGMTSGADGKYSGEFIEESNERTPETSGVSKTTETSEASLPKGTSTKGNTLKVALNTGYTGNRADQLANQSPESKFDVPSPIRNESTTETPRFSGKTKGNSRFAIFQSAKTYSNQNVGRNEQTVKGSEMSTVDVGTSSEHEQSSEVISETDQPSSPISHFQLNLHITNQNSQSNNMKSLTASPQHNVETTREVKNGDTGSADKRPPHESIVKHIVYVKHEDVPPSAGVYPSDSRLRVSTSLSSAITSNNIPSSNTAGTFTGRRDEPSEIRRPENYKTGVPYGPEFTARSKKMFESGFTETNKNFYAGQNLKTGGSTNTNSYLVGNGPTNQTPGSSTNRRPSTLPQVNENILAKPHSVVEAQTHYLKFNSKLLSRSNYQGQYGQGSASRAEKINEQFPRETAPPSNYNQPLRAHFSQEGLSTYARLQSAFNSPNAPLDTTEKGAYTKTQNESGASVQPQILSTIPNLNSAPPNVAAKKVESYLSENSNLSPLVHSPRNDDDNQGMKVVYSENSWPIENTYNAFNTTTKKYISAHPARQPLTASPHQAPSLNQTGPLPGATPLEENSKVLSQPSPQNEKKSSHMTVSKPSSALLQSDESYLSNYRALAEKIYMSMPKSAPVLFPRQPFKVNLEHPQHVRGPRGKLQFNHPSSAKTLQPNTANIGFEVEATAMSAKRHEGQRLPTNVTQTASLPSQWRQLISESVHSRFGHTSLYKNTEGKRTQLLPENKTSSTLPNMSTAGNIATPIPLSLPNGMQLKNGSSKTEPTAKTASVIVASTHKIPNFIPTMNTARKGPKEPSAAFPEKINAPGIKVLTTTRRVLPTKSKKEGASQQPHSMIVAHAKRASLESKLKSPAEPSMTPPHLQAPRLSSAEKSFAELPKQQSGLLVKKIVTPALTVLQTGHLLVRAGNKVIKMKPPSSGHQQTETELFEGEHKKATQRPMGPFSVNGENIIPAKTSAQELSNKSSAVLQNEVITPKSILSSSPPRLPIQESNLSIKIQSPSPQVKQTKSILSIGEIKRIRAQPTAPSLPIIESLATIKKSEIELAKALSAVHARETTAPVISVPPSTPSVPVQGGNVAGKIQPSSTMVEPTKSPSFAGLKKITSKHIAPYLTVLKTLAAAVKSAPELPKRLSAVQAHRITTPVLNVPPLTRNKPAQTGNVKIEVQQPSKRGEASQISSEGELNRSPRPATAPFLPTTETATPAKKIPSELSNTTFALQQNETNKPGLDVAPSIPIIPTQGGTLSVKVEPPSQKNAAKKNTPFESELKKNAEHATAPSLPVIKTLAPAEVSPSESPNFSSPEQPSKISTPLLNIAPPTATVPMEKGNVEKRVQPLSLNGGSAKNIPVGGELEATTAVSKTTSIPTIETLNPAVKSTTRSPNTLSPVQASDISTTQLHVPPVIPAVSIQGSNMKIKIQPSSPKARLAPSIAFKGKLKSTAEFTMTRAFTTAVESSPKLPRRPSSVQASEISAQLLNVPPSTPIVATLGGNIDLKVKPPSRKAGPAKAIALEGEIKKTTALPTVPSLPTTKKLIPAAESAPKLPKRQSVVQASEISTPQLNAPPSTPIVATLGGNIEMKVQPPSRKAEAANTIALEGELKKNTANPKASLPIMKTLPATVESAPELSNRPFAVQKNQASTPVPAMAPPLPTSKILTQAGEAEPELPKRPSAGSVSQTTTLLSNVPPTTLAVAKQRSSNKMKVQPPLPKAKQAKSILFEGEHKRTTKPAIAPSFRSNKRVTPVVRFSPESPNKTSPGEASEISTPLINVPLPTPTISTQAGNVKMKVQPPSLMVKPVLSRAFEGELTRTKGAKTAPSLATIKTVTSAVEFAPESSKKPSPVQASKISATLLSVPLPRSIEAKQESSINMKVKQPARMGNAEKSMLFEGELKRTTEPRTASSLPTTKTLSSAVKSASESRKRTSAVQTRKISVPLMNLSPSKPTIATQEGNIKMKVPSPSPQANPAKSISLEDEHRRITIPAMAQSLQVIKTLTPSVKSAPDVLKKPTAVQSSKVTTPLFNVLPSTPMVETQGGSIEVKIQQPSPKVGRVKSIPLGDKLKRTTEPPMIPSLPTYKTLNQAAESAPELPKRHSAVQTNQIATPVLSITPSTPRIQTQGENREIKLQPVSANPGLPKSKPFKGELRRTTETAMTPPIRTIETLTPAVESTPESPMRPSTAQTNETTTTVLNVPSTTRGIHTKGGNIKMKLQPPSPNSALPKSKPFQVELKRITENATTPSLQTIQTSTPAVKFAVESRNKSSAVQASKVTTPLLSELPSSPMVATQETNIEMKVQPPSPKAAPVRSIPFEGELKRTTETAMTPFISSTNTLTPAGKSAPKLPKRPSATQTDETTTPVLNVQSSTTRIHKQEGNTKTKLQPPSPKVGLPKNKPFEGQPKRTTQTAMTPSLSTIKTLTQAVKSGPELPKRYSAVKMNEATTPILNVPSSTRRIHVQTGNIDMKLQLPSLKAGLSKSIAFEGEVKRTKELPMPPSLPITKTLTPVPVSAPEMPKRPAVRKNQITTPLFNVPLSTPVVATQGSNLKLKLQPPSRMAKAAKSVPFEGKLKRITGPATAPSTPAMIKLTNALKSATELPKRPPAVQTNQITTPVLGAPPSTPIAATQGDNIKMKVQPRSPKAKPAKSIPLEDERRRTTEPAMIPSLTKDKILNQAVQSVLELPKKPSLQTNLVTTSVLNDPPSTPTVSTQARNKQMKKQPPSSKAKPLTTISFEGELKGITEHRTAPPNPVIVTLTNNLKPAPVLLKRPSALQRNQIVTPILNVSPSAPTMSAQAGNKEMKNQPPLSKAKLTTTIPFEGGAKSITEPAAASSIPMIVTLNNALKSTPELPKRPSAVPVNDILPPLLNIRPSKPRVPAPAGHVSIKEQPPLPKAGLAKGIFLERELKKNTEPATAPSLPKTKTLTPVVKSAAELPRSRSAMHVTPVLKARPSEPRVPMEGVDIAIKTHPPTTKLGPNKNVFSEVVQKPVPKAATSPSLRMVERVTAAEKSAAVLTESPSAVHASEKTTPVRNTRRSTSRKLTEGSNVTNNIHSHSQKLALAKSGFLEGGLNKPSAVLSNNIITPGFTRPSLAPVVSNKAANVPINIKNPSPNIEVEKTVSLEGAFKTDRKLAIASSLQTTQPLTPAEKLATQSAKKSTTVHANDKTLVFHLPPSTPKVNTQGNSADVKILPLSPKVKLPKRVPSMSELNQITKQRTAPSIPTTKSLTPVAISAVESPKTPPTKPAEITTPGMNIPLSASIVPMQGVNVAMKSPLTSRKSIQAQTPYLKGNLKRTTELATPLFRPTVVSSTPALKSAAESPETPSAVHTHKMTTPVFGVPLLKPSNPKNGSNTEVKIPPHSRKVELTKSAVFDDTLKRTTWTALAPSLLKVKKLSSDSKPAADLAKKSSAHLVKGIITTGLNLPPTTSKVPTLVSNEGAKMQLPIASAMQTKGASFRVEPKRATENAGGSSQIQKLGHAISTITLAKKGSSRHMVKVNPMEPKLPPTTLTLFTKGGNARRNMQPPAPRALHPKNGYFERQLQGSTESAISSSIHTDRTSIPTLKSGAAILKQPSAQFAKQITNPGVTTPDSLGKAGIGLRKVQQPTPNVSQLAPLSVTASQKRSVPRNHNGLTEFEISRHPRMHKKESKMVRKVWPPATTIRRENTVLALPIQNGNREPHATPNAPINQNANPNVVAQLASRTLLLRLKKPGEANFTSHSADALLTKGEVPDHTHRQPYVQVLLQPAYITHSQASNIFPNSPLTARASPYTRHDLYPMHNVRTPNEQLTSLQFSYNLAQVDPLAAALPNTIDQGRLFEATLQAISRNIDNPMTTKSRLQETMRPPRGSPSLMTLIERARSKNFRNGRFGAPAAKNLFFRGNILYNAEPLRERNDLTNYALFGPRGIRTIQQPSSLRGRNILEEKIGTVSSLSLSGRSPHVTKLQKLIEPPKFICERIPTLPSRVPILVKCSLNVLKPIYQFLVIKTPNEWIDYSSNLIYALLYLRLYSPLPYWHSTTFEYFLSQKVESGHHLVRRPKLMPLIAKAERNVRGFFLPLRTPPVLVPAIPVRNFETRRTRPSHLLPKTDFELRYAHQPTTFSMLPHWHPKTFEHFLSNDGESGRNLVRRHNFSPSVENSDRYVTGSTSPLRAYFYSSQISPKATATSRTSGASRFPGSMNLASRKLYSSNILQSPPSLPLLYAIRSPWYPRTVEHVLSQEYKNRKGLLIKRILFPFMRNDGNGIEARTPAISAYS
ncbi:uncharacterized protein LOC142803946 [Rhipicephalus microplus]|uniref:uncharacterized protein LOC142803946 n=1 Tax=Rhipicephalus microplus TaxID=6941 RepID=UPI003F6C28E8